MTDPKAPVALADDALAGITGGARIPTHTPEFRNPSAGDPGLATGAGHELGHTVQQTGASGGTTREPASGTLKIAPEHLR